MYQEIWAKTDSEGVPNYPLLAHLLDASSAMTAVWEYWLRPGLRQMLQEELGNDAQKIAMYLAGIHDIGKANPVFSAQLAADHKGERTKVWQQMRATLREEGYEGLDIPPRKAKGSFLRRHERVGAAHFVDDIPGWVEADAADEWVPLVVLGHHGRFSLDYDEMAKNFKRVRGKWEDARLYFEQTVETACGITKAQLPDSVPVSVIILLSGMVILADRLASTQESVLDAQDLLKQGTIDLEHPKDWVRLRAEFFARLLKETLGVYQGFSDPKTQVLGSYQPRGAQVGALEVPGGLWLVTAATGSGKTEASILRHAACQEPLTVLLPTQAVTNAQMRRFQKLFAKTGNTAALAHGMAALEDFYDADLADGNSSSSKEKEQLVVGSRGLFPTDFVSHGSARLLASVTVGTVDQALMASLPLKWTHLRLLALANSHVIIDEAHTLDEYQQELACVLLEWLGTTDARVTLLSATMDSHKRQRFLRAYSGQDVLTPPAQFPATELVSSRRRLECGDLEEIAVTSLQMEPYDLSLEVVETADTCADHIAWAKRMRQQYPKARLGIVVNQIGRAQDIAQALADSGQNVLVLHSRMTAQHRVDNARELEEILGPNGTGEGVTVVGTQAIEAALDIDLDALSTDLAPASSIVQRAGRVWRRPDPRRPERLPGIENLPLRVVAGTSDGWHYPYLEAPLLRAQKWLGGRSKLVIPRDLQDLVETEVPTALDEMQEADYVEFASGSLKKQVAGGWSKRIQRALSPDARTIDLSGLTSIDTDEDEFPATRYIEGDSARVLLLDSEGKIPGGWRGSLQDLRDLAGKKSTKEGARAQLRQAMGASIQVSGALLRELRGSEDTIVALSDGPRALRGVLVGEVPSGMIYDSLVGLRKISDGDV